MRSSIWALSFLGIGGFAAAMAQSPVSPPVQKRGATLLPPVPITPEDAAPIARAAADDSPSFQSTTLAQPRPTPALWANGLDPNVVPASGVASPAAATSAAPSVPASDDQSALSHGLDKLKGAFTGGNSTAANSHDQPNASSPFRGTAPSGAVVYAGPPAYRWYGWGSVTPGANPYAPNGQYPKASANWYSITGATPGAFPVAVTNAPRMSGPEPPAYVTTQSPTPASRPAVAMSVQQQQNTSAVSRPASSLPSAAEQPRPSPLPPPDLKVWTMPPAPPAPNTTKPETPSPVAPSPAPITPEAPLPPPSSLRDPIPGNPASTIAPAAPVSPDAVLPLPIMPFTLNATPAPLPPLPTVPTLPMMPIDPPVPAMPAPTLETQSGVTLPVQPDKLPTIAGPLETTSNPSARAAAALPSVPPDMKSMMEGRLEPGDPKASLTGVLTPQGMALPNTTPATLPNSVTDSSLKWQPTNEQSPQGQWNSTGKAKPAQPAATKAPAGQATAPQPLPPQPPEPPAAQPPKTEQPTELPPPNWQQPGAIDIARPQVIARGQAADDSPDPVFALIQKICKGRAEGLDIRWTGSKRVSICFECQSAADAKKLVQDICTRQEFVSYRIDFCVLVK